MNIPRQRRYPYRPVRKRITIAVNMPSTRQVVDAITAAIKAGERAAFKPREETAS